jgi:hypothetical protein
MRVVEQALAGDGEADLLCTPPIALLPICFSLQTLMGVWEQWINEAPAHLKDTEPIFSLHTLQKEHPNPFVDQQSNMNDRYPIL